ncbi:MAG: (2Fe-2S) ferredoxin domain-containing protein [Kiritimatiellae bacterium]|nr:(2Fe-2S) ferredoxin domain-containing protein [Kiritimatiellia bacterium]
MKTIVICMGSSCFARGNARNVELAEAFLDSHPEIEARVDLRGGLCCDRCADGPNVVVDGTVHTRVDEPAMRTILDGLLG